VRYGFPARLGGAAVGLMSLAAMPGARAETVYVIEQLVVNVNSAPDASGERIATVKSGEALEVLERSGEQVHVRLPGGKDGWIRAGYVSADEPLRARLTQRDAELARLKDELTRLRSPPAPAHTAPEGPATGAPGAGGAGAAPPPVSMAAVPPGEDPSTAPQRSLFNTPEEEAPPRVWPWALGSALVALGVGFVLGALTLDRHIRRKYGGLRIY
jgi:Bacterial SH3 domain